MKTLLLALTFLITHTPVMASDLWKSKELPAVNAWSTLIIVKAIPMKTYSRSEDIKIYPTDDSLEGINNLAQLMDQIFMNTYRAQRRVPKAHALNVLFNSLSEGETVGQFAEVLSQTYQFQIGR